MYPVFTHMPGESYYRRLGSLLYLCYVFRVLRVLILHERYGPRVSDLCYLVGKLERCIHGLVVSDVTLQHVNRRSSEIQGIALGKSLRAWTCGCHLAHSRHAFVGGTVSTWGR